MLTCLLTSTGIPVVASAAGQPHARPTIVLVHGAWAGPAGWDEVTAKLHKDGYPTATPALGLLSSYQDVAIVRAQLDAIPGDKILVGHSYGGSVIAQAAAGRSDVSALVYTAAFVPSEGQSLIDLGAGYLPPAALQPGHLIFLGEPFASPSLIAPEFFRADFAADLSPKLAAKLSGQQGPTSFGLFFEPAGPVGRPAVVVRGLGPGPHGGSAPPARHGHQDRRQHRHLRRGQPRRWLHPLRDPPRQPHRTRGVGEPFASPSLIAPEFFRADFAADLSPKLAANLSGQQGPTSFGLFFEPAGPVGDQPSWYAVSGLDRMVDPRLQRDTAISIGAHTVTFDEASHAGGYTHYATRLTNLIERAVISGGT